VIESLADQEGAVRESLLLLRRVVDTLRDEPGSAEDARDPAGRETDRRPRRR
jgi:hypothetical protein